MSHIYNLEINGELMVGSNLRMELYMYSNNIILFFSGVSISRHAY